jgi:hypothetical protein
MRAFCNAVAIITCNENFFIAASFAKFYLFACFNRFLEELGFALFGEESCESRLYLFRILFKKVKTGLHL